MNANIEAQAQERPIDRWFAHYSADHQNETNQKIHVIAVPVILWTVTALLWCIPTPEFAHARPGLWAAVSAWVAWIFYNRASRPLGYGMLTMLFVMLSLNYVIFSSIGRMPMLKLAAGVFVLAWIAQFVGHKIEGKRPSFLTDLVYLLIGPAWVLAKAYRKLGWPY